MHIRDSKLFIFDEKEILRKKLEKRSKLEKASNINNISRVA